MFVLAINDHLLKAAYPSWWTGKLSDFAGVILVGTTFAVLVGPNRGLPLAALGFVALKSIPHVAELVAPALGGVTARDTTDLLAVTALLPLWFLLQRPQPQSDEPPKHAGRVRGVERLRRGFAAALPIAGAVIAVGTATATSCAPSPAVTLVRVQDGVLVASVSEGWGDPDWARSDDGGFTWSRTSEPSTATPTTLEVLRDPGPTGSLDACASDGTCWRIHDQRSIERRPPGGEWTEEFRLSDSDFDAISTGCTDPHVGVLSSIAVLDSGSGSEVAASLGADGVVARDSSGSWSRHGVLSAAPARANDVETNARWSLLFFGPVVALLVGTVGRRWLPSWRTALAVIGVGWLATIMAAGALSFLAGSDNDSSMVGRVAVAGMAVTSIATVVVGRRKRGLSSLPPPPPLDSHASE